MLWAGAVLALVIAAGLFSRFSIDDTLWRDEAIYAYGGQQLAEGVPPYESILDAKTPLATMVAGAAVATGRAAGVDDVHAIRLAFFVFACLTVAAVYLVGLWLFQSWLAGLVSAATFATFKGFALDALGGPDAKTPGIFFAVLATLLLLRRRWFWGAFSGSLAFLVWQPLAIYALVAIVVAWLASETDERWRRTGEAVAGAVLPVAATLVYFLAAGALRAFVDGAFVLALTGTKRKQTSFFDHPGHIVDTVRTGYGASRFLFWGGLLVLLAFVGARIVQSRSDLRALRGDPLVTIILPPLLFFTAVSLVDFQGYPDVYPFLLYPALGIGGGVAAVGVFLDARRPPLGAAAGCAVVVALVATTWIWYSADRARDTKLVSQRAHAAKAESLLDPRDTVYSFGNATPLVLMQRRNPNPYIYLSAGVDQWAVDHIPGGFEGWVRGIRAHDPAMIVSSGPWNGEIARRMRSWLRASYPRIQVGNLRLFVEPAVRDRAVSLGLAQLR